MLAWLQQYFNMRRWQAISIVVLFIIIGVVAFINNQLPNWLRSRNTTQKIATLTKIADSLSRNDTSSKKKYDIVVRDGSNLRPFPFDPNTINEEQWLALGLNQKQVNTILNYRNKGGQFYTKADVQKMYSINEQEFKVLEPYIKIAAKTNADTRQQKKIITPVEINTCDTADLVKLPGIASYSAYKIVQLRKQLGGFISLSQLLDAGVSATNLELAKPYLQLNKAKVNLINVNAISFQDLRSHPLCNEAVALAICKYRKEKGTISNLTELQAISNINQDILSKLMPYLSTK